MDEAVRLRHVTAKNWRAVARLELDPSQEGLVAPNLYSIAQSKFDPNAHPRAVYAGKELVGLLMYDVWDEKDGTREASIYRFMIDRKHQGKAYGRPALALSLAVIKALPRLQ